MLLTAPNPPSDPAANRAWREAVDSINEQLQSRIAFHQRFFRFTWYNSDFTPAQFFAAAGVEGGMYLAIARANLNHVIELAGLIGKTLADLMAAEDYEPPMTIAIAPNGTVTLSPL